ncbi:SH3 domain-containing protein 2 isoform X2 [Cryptomeria japonica]|uniref:SH3 domain-containing protein 2 isoform X2 n=1 Tax=Cryptomeria japonica TaxID=3369 RepID=UPI0025AB7692|nr:SH3 domain-containing protein 2 isoform X2 [Cryptomeria japonica]
MDALRKQANKLREQVAKQQQAVLKQFNSSGYGSSDTIVIDEVELQRHQLLEKLFVSTRTGKHFQRDIVRGVEGLVSSGSRQIEIGTKLSEDCRKYGDENPSYNGGLLAKSACIYGMARAHMEKERDNLNKSLASQIAEPLRAMITGAPLEDARHLAQRYDQMRQEAELQGTEVSKRQARVREVPDNPDNRMKLQAAEAKMQELKANMAVLGKEAAAAMASVESQQQRLTLQRLIALVETERIFHHRIAQILDECQAEMVSEKQRIESAPSIVSDNYIPPPTYEEFKMNGSRASQISSLDRSVEIAMYFLAEAMHAFEAESEGELSLAIGDYVVVRQVLTCTHLQKKNVPD